MKNLLSTTILAAALISCDNPADRTISAELSEAKSTLLGTGTKYTFSKQSTLGFTGSKVTGSHEGGFNQFSGHFTMNDGGTAPASGLITIEMASVYTDDDMLTEHLKSADFFEVAKFPTATFTLTDIHETGDQTFKLSGNFNLHGVTQNITFPARGWKDDDRLMVQAEFDINRKDFGIIYAGKTDDLIRDEVIIRFDLEALPQ